MGRNVCTVREWRNHPYGRGVRVFVREDGFVLLYHARQGFVYRGRCVPFLRCGSEPQRMEVSEAVWGDRAMKKKSTRSGAAARLHASPDLLKGHYPKLAEFLTSGVYDDGERREAPTVTIWAAGGQWKCILKDRGEQLVMWLSAERLLELMKMAEDMCLEEDGPWRVDDQSINHGKRKKGLG